MNVQVFSMIAAVHGAEKVMWSGDIPDECIDALGPEQVNSFLFRFFNRVEGDEDERQLELLGYDLPSLSMGDFITWGSRTFRVAAQGFEEVTGNGQYLYLHIRAS